MNNLINSFAATTIAVVIVGVVPNWLTLGPATYNSESRGFDEAWPFGPESTQQ